tara:strand:- start:2349 stop:2915 length:567 start_codon:yes stop_codon:yes gene_type:complete
MIKIAILGGIGSGKSYIAKSFGHPVFNADTEVANLYKKDKKIFYKLKKELPGYFKIFPIDKKEVSRAILDNHKNLKRIIKIVHSEIRKKLKIFLKKNIKKKIVILDIPLLLENKINGKNDILVFVQSKKTDVIKKLKKRKNFNQKLLNIFKNIQFTQKYKKSKSHYVIKNNFTKKSVKNEIYKILKKL